MRLKKYLLVATLFFYQSCSKDCDASLIVDEYNVENASLCSPYREKTSLTIAQDGAYLDRFIVLQTGNPLIYKAQIVSNAQKKACILKLEGLPVGDFCTIEFIGKDAELIYGKDGLGCSSSILRKK
jgi:hypothetical protein